MDCVYRKRNPLVLRIDKPQLLRRFQIDQYNKVLHTEETVSKKLQNRIFQILESSELKNDIQFDVMTSLCQFTFLKRGYEVIYVCQISNLCLLKCVSYRGQVESAPLPQGVSSKWPLVE